MASTLNPITEMGRFIRGSIRLCREKRRFAELLGWEAAEDIQADVTKHQQAVAADAYSAEQSDIEALKLLESAAADGLQQSDMPAVAAAIRHIRRSAEKDHAITEAAAS